LKLDCVKNEFERISIEVIEINHKQIKIVSNIIIIYNYECKSLKGYGREEH